MHVPKCYPQALQSQKLSHSHSKRNPTLTGLLLKLFVVLNRKIACLVNQKMLLRIILVLQKNNFAVNNAR